MDLIETARQAMEALVTQWQQQLDEQVLVRLGGSLVSGLAIITPESTEIDADVTFLLDFPQSVITCTRICEITGMREVLTGIYFVEDWPTGRSRAIKLKGRLEISGLPFAIALDGLMRNPAYVGWARFYPKVFTPDELEVGRQQKLVLHNDLPAYRAFKQQMLQEAKERVLHLGLLEPELLAMLQTTTED
jgi:hypothetical protein